MKLLPLKPAFKTKGASNRARERRRGRGLTNRRSRSPTVVILPLCFLWGTSTFAGTGHSTSRGTSSEAIGSGSCIFGSMPTPSASTGCSIFGSTPSASPGSSIFGSMPTPSASTGCSIFGSTPSASTGSSIFGSMPMPSASTGCSIFGSTPSASTGSSIFGSMPTPSASNGCSIFGSTPSASTGSSIFGAVTPPTASTGSSVFGGTSSAIPSTGSSIFGFSVGATSSASTNQAQVSNPFSVGSAQASVNATVLATSTQSTPNIFGSISPSTSFGLAGNPAFSSGSYLYGSSTSTFGLNCTSSSEANSISSTSGSTNDVFGSSWQAPKTLSFASTFNSSSPSTRFLFGTTSSSAATISAPLFGSSTNTTSSSIFPFSSAAAATSSQPAFGNAASAFAFGSTPSNNNNDQVGMEDSMAEDTVQASTPAVPIFGQQPMTPSTGFVFGSTTPSRANPFQVGSQQSLATPQNPSPFQASGNLDFNAGGSFTLGSYGVYESQIKIKKLKGRHRRK